MTRADVPLLIAALLLGAVAVYSLLTLYVGTTYTSCQSFGADGGIGSCTEVLVPIPQAAVPAALAIVALVGLVTRRFGVAWLSLVGLLVFGFLSGFSIGAPIFLGALAAIPFVALGLSRRAARYAALGLAVAMVAFGLLVVALTFGSIGAPDASGLAAAAGFIPVVVGAIVAVGIWVRSRLIAWAGLIIGAVLLLPFLPFSLVLLTIPAAIALLLRPALQEPSCA